MKKKVHAEKAEVFKLRQRNIASRTRENEKSKMAEDFCNEAKRKVLAELEEKAGKDVWKNSGDLRSI